MGSKKRFRFNYRVRIFLPTALLIWATIAVGALYSYKREKDYRQETVLSDLMLITDRLIHMYEQDLDFAPFLEFVDQYYGKADLKGIKVTMLNPVTGEIMGSLGEPMSVDGDLERRDEFVAYYEGYSPGHEMKVMTALPFDVSVDSWFKLNSGYWLFMMMLAGGATLVVYFFAYHQARNVMLLRAFTEKAAHNDDSFELTEKFPNDELGDISRQIIEIYKSRQDAMAAHEREHRIALRATEEKIKIKRQLANNVGHELKTPVGIVRGYVDTLVSNPEMDIDSRQHFLRKTQQHVERLCSMLDDLSTLTRLDEGGGMITSREVDMNILLADITDEIDESGIGGDMTFIYDVPVHCVVCGSETLINAAIMNLVKNAVAYSKGTEMGVLFTGKTSSHYSFVFYDNGTGVAPEHLPRLFDRFYRIDTGRSRKTGGTGLGLPIVKSTFINMGGTITVRNREGGGLEFCFTMPVWKPKK
ncbi:MAG: HAMP domain-containing histidine kinase [Muribaculaceae bacterium]|nr:HAMP domain-containing histidine kinase [Muribaculaceae bacterium]